MKTYKILAVISVSGVKTDDDAVSALEKCLSDWEGQKVMYWGYEDSNINMTIKTIKED